MSVSTHIGSVCFLCLLVLTGCSAFAPRDSRPAVVITAPADGATIRTGREIEVVTTATDDRGVVRVDLYVNNQLIRTDTPPEEIPQYSYSVVQRWVPPAPGPVVIKVLAYDDTGQASVPAAVEVEAVGSTLVTTAPSPTPTMSVAASPTPISPTPTATPTPEPVIAGTVNVPALNVREGPGTTFAVLASVRFGERVDARTRSEDGEWVQIQLADEGDGWVAATYVTWDEDVSTLPVAVEPAATSTGG